MEKYKVLVLPSVEKDLDRFSKKVRIKIIKKMNSLAENPRPHGSIKLTGKNTYRLRQGNYRILYNIIDIELIVTVIKVGDRKNI